MSRKDTPLTEGLRNILGFRENYDVVLACAFEPEENGNTKFELYDKIGLVVKNISKRPYLPHKELNLNWPLGKIYSIPNGIVIPTADVVIAYLGLPSSAGGTMIGSAVQSKIPIIYLYEKTEDFESFKIRADTITLGTSMVDRGILDRRDCTKDLEFDALNIRDGNLKNLKDCLIRFYQTQQ